MRRLSHASLLLILAVSVLAHDHDPEPVAVLDPEAHKPSGLPDRIILTFKGDPATSQAVTWRTDTTVAPGYALAEIAKADDGPLFKPTAKSLKADTTPLKSDLGEAHYHSVIFEDLEPATKYLYRVGDGVNWSEWIQFRTASNKPEPFSFIYFGDAQNDIKEHWSRVIRQSYSDAPKARFMIHAGDLINNANRDAQWGEWHRAGGWLNAMVPSIPTPGNHEYEKATPTDAKAGVSRHWKPQVTLPDHGPAGLEETCYYVDYQGARIVSLNSNEMLEEQATWVDALLAKNPNKWTVLTFHHPVYSSAEGRDNKTVRDTWQPIFDKHKVDLVLQGHDHTYARSGLRVWDNVATGASVQDGKTGTVYVVSVSGPKMYNLDREPWMQRAAEDTQLYQIIHIDNDTLRYEARTATGNLYDAFDLNKRVDQPNELVAKTPKTAERLRPEGARLKARQKKAQPKPKAATVGAGLR